MDIQEYEKLIISHLDKVVAEIINSNPKLAIAVKKGERVGDGISKYLENKFVEFTNERIIPASGLAVVGALLGKSGFIKKLNRMDVTSNRSQHQIKNGDIVLTYLGMLCMGKPYFEAFSLSSENFAEKARMTGLKWQSSIAGM